MIHKMLLGLLLLMFFSFSGRGQELAFRNYSMKDGLPSTEVHGILQDKKGYIWIATDRGLTRYNGNEFIVFNEKNGLPNATILAFFEESETKFWIVTVENKLFSFDPTASRLHFKPYKYNTSLAEKANSLSGSFYIRKYWKDQEGIDNFSFRRTAGIIQIDLEGKAEIKNYVEPGIQDYQIFIHFSTNENGSYAYSEIIKNTTSPNEIWLINDHSGASQKLNHTWSYANESAQGVTDFELNKDGLWILMGRFVIKVANGKHEAISLPTEGVQLSFSKSEVYITTRKGAYILNTELELKRHLLSDSFLTTLMKDNQSGIWVGTIDKGVFYTPADRISKLSGLDNTVFNSLALTDQQLIGIDRNFVAVVFDKKGKTVHKVPKSNYLNGLLRITGVNGSYEYLGIIELDPVAPFVSSSHQHFLKNFYYLRELPEDTVWTSSAGNFVLLHQGNHLTSVFASDIRHIRSSVIWKDSLMLLATESGLFTMDFQWNVKKFDSQSTIFDIRLVDVQLFREGFIVATRNKGLLCYQNGRIHKVGKEEGLFSDDVTSLIVHTDSLISVGTFGGVHQITVENSFDEISIDHIGTEHGLAHNKVISMTANSDSLWVSTVGGLCVLPIRAKKTSTLFSENQFHLDSVLIDGIRNTGPISFQEGAQLEIYFNQLAYVFDAPISYLYRISTFGSQWEKTKDNSLKLNYLPIGKHSIEIRAISKNGKLGPIKRIDVVVTAPYWKKWWFLLLEILIVIVLFFIIVRYFLKRLEKRKQLEISQVKLEMNALVAQMNPHFTFNTINSIQHYIIKRDRHAALDYLSEFAELVRKTLDYSRKDMISLKEEIHFLQDYVALEKKRFDLPFDFVIETHCETNLDQIMIPSLILQPLVENAIVHGVGSAQDKGRIELEIKESKDAFLINITDNGSKSVHETNDKKEKYKSHGTDILRQRLKLYNSPHYQEGDLQFINLANDKKGTRVTIKLFKQA